MQTCSKDNRELHLHGAGDHYLLSKKVANLFEKEYCILTNSGTSAIETICEALKIKRKIVYTSNYQWPGAIAPFLKNENRLIIGKGDRNFSIDVEDLAGYSPDVVFAVDFMGIAHSDQEKIGNYCKEKSITYITDACCSMGAWQHEALPTGYYSDVVVTSFGPQKTFYGGEGGAILTNSEQIYEACLYLIEHPYRHIAEGLEKNYYSMNRRMNPLGISYLLQHFDIDYHKLKSRQKNGYALYKELTEENIPDESSPIYTPFNSVYQDLIISLKLTKQDLGLNFNRENIKSINSYELPFYLNDSSKIYYTPDSVNDYQREFFVFTFQ
jgi:dTDP-4-amino-4,6-dideoxygalactose transaminase